MTNSEVWTVVYELSSGVTNTFGLPIDAVTIAIQNGPSSFSNLTASSTVVTIPYDRLVAFPNVRQPQLEPISYYFAPPHLGPYDSTFSAPIPGEPAFSPTNTSPLLVASVGEPYTVSGWAKKRITNGDTNKFAYLEQLFDHAYKTDANGNATTNETELLSEYGKFFPTEPGRVALTTKPDIETSEVGQAIVNVISVNVDANHDGVMDLTFGGADSTSAQRPFVFWANNDFDRLTLDKDDNRYYEDSVERADCPFTSSKITPDCNYRDGAGNRVIPSTRDLQDFIRLWVSGITTNMLAVLPTNSTITLSWGDEGSPNSGNPTIDLFKAADADGGIGYLTNSTTALVQTLALSYPHVGRLGPGQSIQLNASTFANHWAGNYFIWCGVTNGSGALTLTIADGSGNTLAQTMAYIQIQDIKQMYERWTIGDNPSIPPKTNAIPAVEDAGSFEYGPPDTTATPYVLYVHGWNMKRWEKDRFAESAFKRVYWQGYQGRFGLFRWPPDNGFQPEFSVFTSNPLTDPHNYDNSEYTAWRSAAGLLNKLNDLNAKYPGHVYMMAHSMGNVLAGEALRLAGNNQIVNTYVASQAAIPAHVYDASVTNLLLFVYNHPDVPNLFEPSGFNYGPTTPNIYGNRLASNSAAAGRRINFYNANDYALVQPRWGYNQIRKPDTFFLSGHYTYNGSTNDAAPWNNFGFVFASGDPPSSLDIVNNLLQRYEAISYAAESYSISLGAAASLTTFDGKFDLSTTWPTDTTGHNYGDHFWHSAQFRGDSTQQWGYWRTLLRSPTVGFNISN